MRLLTILSLLCTAVSCTQSIKIPIQENNYIHVYQPAGDTFLGPSTKYLEEGKYYEDWIPNDHTIVKGNDGYWHMFGITHPCTPITAIHNGGFQSTHVVSKTKDFKGSFEEGGWVDKPKVLTRHDTNHSPNIAEKDGVYYMLYGRRGMLLATSTDLYNWKKEGYVFEDTEHGDPRDPHIVKVGDTYYVSYCVSNGVAQRSSKDLRNWSDAKLILTPDYDPESPSIVEYNGKFYLFVCVWRREEMKGNIKTIDDAYPYETYVYVTDNIGDVYDSEDKITELNAHAPEIFQDEDGDWYISSAQRPNRGVSIDKLTWK